MVKLSHILNNIVRGGGEDGGEGSSKWISLLALLVYVATRLFGLVLVFFMFSLYAVVAEDEDEDGFWWLQWMDEAVGLIVTAVMIGLVQIGAMLFMWWRIKRSGEGGGWRAVLRQSGKVLLKLLFYEWFLLNLTSLFVSLSSVGLPTVGFDYQITFAICFVMALMHYGWYIRYYMKQRPWMYWRFRDCFLLCLPLTIFFSLTTIMFVWRFVQEPVVDLVRAWLIASIFMMAFALLGLPSLLFSLVVEPLQRRHARKNFVPTGRAESELEKAVRKECARASLARHELKSVMCVGMGVRSLQELEGATRLQRLYVSCNRLTTLHGVEGLHELELLDVEDNQIASYTSVLPLTKLARLETLNMGRNRLDSGRLLRLRLCALLPQLREINGMPVCDELRLEAERTQGDWLHAVQLQGARESFRALGGEAGGHVHELLRRQRLGLVVPNTVPHGTAPADTLARRLRHLRRLTDVRNEERERLLPLHDLPRWKRRVERARQAQVDCAHCGTGIECLPGRRRRVPGVSFARVRRRLGAIVRRAGTPLSRLRGAGSRAASPAAAHGDDEGAEAQGDHANNEAQLRHNAGSTPDLLAVVRRELGAGAALASQDMDGDIEAQTPRTAARARRASEIVLDGLEVTRTAHELSVVHIESPAHLDLGEMWPDEEPLSSDRSDRSSDS